jgi:uncharacterized membrane protein
MPRLTRASAGSRDPIALREHWTNPDNWDRLGSYYCVDDPRLLVRDRARLGWTLNMGHRHVQRAIWVFLAAVILAVAAVGVAAGR